MPELQNNEQTKTSKRTTVLSIIVLQVAVLVFSFSGVFAKFASGNEFWSWAYWIPYGLSLVCTLVYAILWQQCLKKLPLTTAFLCKSMGTVWAAVFGVVFFQEILSVGKIVGLALVIIGTLVVVLKDE